ncbi:Hint domain-containing protein [Lichenicoccus sp.]|uniref:Hint domain-containing protein n=1 Tax=Lichenicoccus sp. TaxID=2781899 RepID=UPI003D144167
MSDTFVTTTISGAEFSDGSTLSGTWTSEYDSTGKLVAVSNATFTVQGSGGTTTFTNGGTLPYANSPSNTSYEIHFLAASKTGSYTSLYVDWRSENPTSFYQGTPSLYTSVVNKAGPSTTPLRLINDGSSGVGTLPVISGLPSNQNDPVNTVATPFADVTVTDPDTTTATSATIVLSNNGVIGDADGLLSGTGLTKTGAGTYSLAATTPANLTAELRALHFTPATGVQSQTLVDLSINDSDGSMSAAGTLSVPCFLRGVMIATPSGEVPVERLQVGDLVCAIEDGVRIARPVTWLGGRSIDAASFGGGDEAYPVRIRAGAFADGVPHRDLLVTPEHCILTEAGLTPARMLVNGRSIVIDRGIPVYDFFHVELPAHGILLAEGLACESYLDTGNRDLFMDAGARVTVRPGVVMAAPLAVARDLVEPLWTRLSDRACTLGFGGAATARTLTNQPDLRLLLDDGSELNASWHDGQRHVFHIPRDARPTRLLSRAAAPADVVGPFVDDRRILGVAVGRMAVWTGLDETVVPFAGMSLEGWHDAEGGHRWTNGRAALDVPVAGPDTFLDIQLTATALYPETLAA